MGQSMKRVLLWVVLPLLLVTAGFLVYVLSSSSPALRYEMKEGFRGWVVIQYGDVRSPPLPIRKRYLALQIPESGCLCTATTQPLGFRNTVYEYVSPYDQRTEIFVKYGDPNSQILEHVTGKYVIGQKTVAREYFFVGPVSEYSRAPNITQIDDLLCKELR